MENAPASKCPVTDWSNDVRDSVRDGIGLDGQWKPQRLREGTPGCKPVGAGRFPLRSSLPFIDDWVTHLASRRRQGVDVHPSPGYDSRGSQGSTLLMARASPLSY
jgi:hypothetical protein